MKLNDLMTAKQALEILELLNSIDKRLIDLEKKVENIENKEH